MNKNYEKLLTCLSLIQQTLSVCSKCYECCNDEQKEIYGELSEDAARMSKKIKAHMSNQ